MAKDRRNGQNMKMLILGGAASGKSAFAEKRAVERAKEQEESLTYLATLHPQSGGDTAERIKKHVAARAGKGFATVEWTDCQTLPQVKGVVLLEDLGNLVANYLYPLDAEASCEREKNGKACSADEALSFLLDKLQSLSAQASDLICVSNEISLGGNLPQAMRLYGEVLARLNAAWAAASEKAYAVVAGIEIALKS